MVDFRWHTASLVAVFLALGVGVLMGGAAVGDGALRARQRAAMHQIEAQFATLREDRTRLTEARRFSQAALPWIVAGRLEGRTVVVIALGKPDAAGQVRAAVSLAGGDSFTVDVPAGLAPARPAGWDAYGPGDRTRQLRRAAVELARGVFGQGALTPLQAAGAVLTSGRPGAADAAVVLVGPKSDPSSVRRIVAALAADRPAGAPVVGAWQGQLPLTALFTTRGMSVVDDAGRPAGQAAIVLCLAGARGHFGQLPGAAGPLPPYGR